MQHNNNMYDNKENHIGGTTTLGNGNALRQTYGFAVSNQESVTIMAV